MANFFPRWTNTVPLKLAVCAAVLGLGTVVAVAYYFTPKYTRVGYQPTQPVPFSHALHVGQLGMDCRLCHSHVEVSSHSNVPVNETCFNCHGPGRGNIRTDSPNLELVREAHESGQPIDWVKVHQAPDYVYFNHSVHIARGVSCASCHGRVDQMEEVWHHEPHSMGWCLDCHREPEKHLRPLDQIYNLAWEPSDEDRSDFYGQLLESGADPSEVYGLITGRGTTNGNEVTLDQLIAIADQTFGDEMQAEEIGMQLKAHWQIHAPETCAACHR